MESTQLLIAFIAPLLLATFTWIISVIKHDVSIVDTTWSLMILASGISYFTFNPGQSIASKIILALLIVWAARLAIYITWRNHGKGEDRRYTQIREKYSPHFAIKSLGIIFIFQAIVAWIIALPLWPALTIDQAFNWLSYLAMLLVITGILFETIADHQLAAFKRDTSNTSKVLRSGLWRYSRHPNYFGECLVWWGFFFFSAAAGYWWTIISPLLMTWLLLKFSGVTMLEEGIEERRPEYRDYIETTSVFIPLPPKSPTKPVATRG